MCFHGLLPPCSLAVYCSTRRLRSRGDTLCKRYVIYLVFGILRVSYLLHHLLLFYLEVFRLSEFFSTLFRVFRQFLTTLSLVILSQFLFVKSRKETMNRDAGHRWMILGYSPSFH